MKGSPDGPRTLYSLRHLYITWQLLRRALRLDILAKQCGSSVAMFEKELSGVKFKKQVGKEKPMTEKALKIIENSFKSWEAEYRQRDCI